MHIEKYNLRSSIIFDGLFFYKNYSSAILNVTLAFQVYTSTWITHEYPKVTYEFSKVTYDIFCLNLH